MADALAVDGAVTVPLTLRTIDLAFDFPPVNVTLANGDSYGGVPVYSLLTAAQFLYPNSAAVKNGFLRDYITVSASNGTQVVLSEGEVDPGFGGAASTDIIAYEKNGQTIAPQLIVPGDVNGGIGGRDIAGVTELTVATAAVPPAFAGQPAAPPLTVTGDVSTPSNPYTAASVQRIGSVQQTDSFAAGTSRTTTTFTGATLQSVLNGAGVSNFQAEDQYVVATGSDGYGAVYSRAEIDPVFRSAPTSLIAYSDTASGALSVGGVRGALRTTAPGDAKGGRYVSALDNLRVGRPQEDVVARLYQGAFGHAPDATGGAVSASLLELGIGTSTLAQGLLSSSEFALGGGTVLDNAGFVSRLYVNELGRPADSGGLSAWTALLNGGTSRADVLAALAATPEAVLHTTAPAG